MNILQVSKQLDNFILDKDEPIWYVKLNNGEMVYQDDDRAGLLRDSWERLRIYCKVNNLAIENIYIKFRSNTIEAAPSGKDGYWFRKGLLAGFNKDNNRRFKDINFYIVGYIEDNVLKVTKWRVPELIDWEKEEREIPIETIRKI